jgi:gluconokinase
MTSVSRAAADPLVLAVDVGSTATRGDVYDATGCPVAGGRRKVAHQFTTAADGTSVIDPDRVVEEVAQVIGGLAGRWRAGRIAAVALDTFASSLVGVGPGGSAVTPCYTYADSRSAEQVAALRRELDEPAVQQRTGCRLHASYLAPRLRWLQATQPAAFTAAARWMSLGEYVYLRLLGTTAAGTSIAAWTGLLDRRTGRWDDELVAAAGLRAGQLSEIRDPDQPFDDAGAAAGSRWPALAGSAWLPVVADGIASNIGTGATGEQAAALAAATSGAIRVLLHHIPATVPAGLWCYRVDRDRSLLGGAVNDVGRMVSWLNQALRLHGHLDLSAAPDPGTPLVLPYLSGERSTGWADAARATFAGVSAATTAAMLARGAMEGVAFSFARIAGQLASAAGPPRQVLASGRITRELPDLLQLLADVLGVPVTPVTSKRTTLRGTAIMVLDVLAPGTPRAQPATGPVRRPVAAHHAHYARRAQAYQALYDAVTAPAAG